MQDVAQLSACKSSLDVLHGALSSSPNTEAAAAPFAELACLSNSIITLPVSSNIRVYQVIHTSGQPADIAQYI